MARDSGVVVVGVLGYVAEVVGGVLGLRKVGGGICCDVRWREKGEWEGDGEVCSHGRERQCAVTRIVSHGPKL